MAEATGEEELIKSFRTAGDLDGSGYALPRFYEDRVSFKDRFVDLPADFSWQREDRIRRSVGAWISHGETHRDEVGMCSRGNEDAEGLWVKAMAWFVKWDDIP